MQQKGQGNIPNNPANYYVEEDEIDLYELWLVLKKRKKLILSLFFLITTLTAVISFMKTPIYKSETSVIPVSNSSSPLEDLADLAAVAGILIGSKGGDSAKIKAVLNSRTIKENIIRKLNLIPVLLDKLPKDRNPMNMAIETLENENIVSVSDDKKTGVIKISVEYKDPRLAQKIAQAYIDELQKIMNEKKLTVAKFNRIFLEKQLKEEEEKLKKLKQQLAEFQKKTKIIAPESQLAGVMNLYSGLISKKLELLVQLRALESTLSPDNSKIKMLKEQIQSINSQIKSIEEKTNMGALPSLAKVPEKLVEYTNIMQKLKISEAVYKNLVKLYEQAKLQEAKENIYVEIIDPPSLPDKPIKPKKKLIVAVAGVSSLFLGIFLAFFLEWLENIKRRHQEESMKNE